MDVWWSGWVWVGECFFWYRPTRVVSDQRPLNGCVRRCIPHVWKLIWLLTQGRAIYWQITWITFVIEAPKCIVNRPIRVGDSKNVIVFDPVPMVTCFGACKVAAYTFSVVSSESRFNSYNSTVNRHSIFQLGGRVDHMIRHVWQLFRVKQS